MEPYAFKHHVPGVSDPLHPIRRCVSCLYSVGFGYDRIAKIVRRPKAWVYRGVKIAIKNGWASRSHHPMPRRLPSIKPPRPRKVFKYSANTLYRKKYLRRKVWCWFKFGLYPKSAPALVGCSRAHFIKHLESQFQRGMTIANYGRIWEIDHIVPCREFDLAIREQQLQCFHFSNLRPLKTSQNRSRKHGAESVQPELLVCL